MMEITANVNWLAVVVGAVVAFLLGWLWYSPKLFGVKWAQGVGVSLDKADGMPVAALIVQAVGTFLLAWIVGVTAAANALLTIILIVAVVVCLNITSGLFGKRSTYAIATESGFIVAMAVIMIVVQGIL